MKYMLLVHHNEDAVNALGEAEVQRMLDDSIGLAHQLHAKGQYLDAAPLQPISTAASVTVRGGKPFVTDGPFAETREQLGGYFLIDAKDRDEAIAIAGRIPGARIGTVEVRPLRIVEGLPKVS